MQKLSLDKPPVGWTIVDTGQADRITAALLAGEAVSLRVEAGPMPGWLGEIPGIVLASNDPSRDAAKTILISDRASAAADLVYRPKTIALGIGCERAATADDIGTFVRQCLM